jgi:tRNA A-37 threonylcarbamoyl transferase component Bud32/DNA-binding response OmpR family regulator
LRLLLIEADPQLESQLCAHVAGHWPSAEIRVWSPPLHGLIPAEFLAQGYDAVLLAERWPGGEGMSWLRDLTGRSGFAPIIFLADSPTEKQRIAVGSWGAVAVLATSQLDPQALIAAIELASDLQHRALGDWRVSPQADEARRFGDARIPGYRRARLLARGSVSRLYIAESEKAGALVVLKVTPSHRDESGVDQPFERFLQEYEIAQKLQHPNIVRLHELGIADDHAYLAMEYFPLGDLRRRVRNGLSPTEALKFAAQIARVLAAIHAEGVVHRDLKPGNVMLRTDDEIALIDFGLAKQLALDLDLTDRGLISGTPHYMSPEQGHGQKMDARSDLYSLGVLLYEMLTGRKPYTADNPMTVLYLHRNSELPDLPGSLASLQPLVHRLLAKLPEDRYATAEAAALAIEAAREAWLARLVFA